MPFTVTTPQAAEHRCATASRGATVRTDPGADRGRRAVRRRLRRSSTPPRAVSTSSAAMARRPARIVPSGRPTTSPGHDVGGPVPGEVTTGDPGERLSRGRRRHRQPVAREDIGPKAADEGPAHHVAAEARRTKRWTSAPPPVRTPTAPTGHGPARGQRTFRRRAGDGPHPRDGALVHPSRWSRRALAARPGAVSAQPRVVGGPHQVQRAAVQPRDDQRTVTRARVLHVGAGQAGRAGPHREQGAAQVLGLDGEQPLGDRDRVARRRPGQELRGETVGEHRPSFARGSVRAGPRRPR
jgi:hypothetical protein